MDIIKYINDKYDSDFEKVFNAYIVMSSWFPSYPSNWRSHQISAIEDKFEEEKDETKRKEFVIKVEKALLLATVIKSFRKSYLKDEFLDITTSEEIYNLEDTMEFSAVCDRSKIIIGTASDTFAARSVKDFLQYKSIWICSEENFKYKLWFTISEIAADPLWVLLKIKDII